MSYVTYSSKRLGACMHAQVVSFVRDMHARTQLFVDVCVHARMCVCMHVTFEHAWVQALACMHCLYVCMCLCVYVRVCVCIVCMYTCVYMRSCVCVCTCLCMHLCVYFCMCVFVYAFV
jgi:hypothetical protein